LSPSPATRRLLLAGAGAASALLALVSWRALPRLTLSNAGIRVDHSLAAPLFALLAAAGAATLAYTLRQRALRGVAALAAAALLLFGLDRAAFRIEADDSGLAVRGLTGARRAPWREVTEVRSEQQGLTIVSRDRPALRMGTGSLSPEQRASLERTIARRLRDAQKSP
jgi:hypothetical protein